MTDIDAAERPDNLVFLRGTLADVAVRREMPSGDVLLNFRLTVPRPSGTRSARDRVGVDSLDCVAVKPKLRRIVERAAPGDRLEVEGRLQRRFWRSPTGPASRYSVAVESVRRVSPRRSTGA